MQSNKLHKQFWRLLPVTS